MRYIAAFLLANLGGNENPSVKDVTSILESVGAPVDQEEAKKILSELSGKDIGQLMAEGSKKLASMPSGGAAVSGASAAGSASSVAAASSEKKEEKKAEPQEEEEGDMGFGLFD